MILLSDNPMENARLLREQADQTDSPETSRFLREMADDFEEEATGVWPKSDARV